MDPKPTDAAPTQPENHHFRFHLPHIHLHSLFGDDWFALKAEAFARFFGTPHLLIIQSAIVALWLGGNIVGIFKFDAYPFILLNLGFSLQSAYAAPLILLAQTRQADRDKVHADADAKHREDLALAGLQRQELAAQQGAALMELLRQNTELTDLTKQLSHRIEALALELRDKLETAVKS